MRKGHVHNEKSIEILKQLKLTPYPEFQWITDFVKQFAEEVQKPLQIRESLIKNREPQRCLTHNIAYSIYCTICRKALCASCMYNTPQHRKHRVIPLENSTEQLKEDMKTFQSKILKIANQAESLIDSNGEILMKIEKQFNPLISKIKEFYENLKQFLTKKQKQQLKQLKEIKVAATEEVSQYNRELSRINQVLMSRIFECKKQNYKFSQPLVPRIILQTVMQTSNFINENLLDGEKFKFPTDIEKIETIDRDIKWKIDTLFNTFQTTLRNSRLVDNKKNQSKSPSKKVSFAETRVKLHQVQERNIKKKNKSMSNIAGRSLFQKH